MIETKVRCEMRQSIWLNWMRLVVRFTITDWWIIRHISFILIGCVKLTGKRCAHDEKRQQLVLSNWNIIISVCIRIDRAPRNKLINYSIALSVEAEINSGLLFAVDEFLISQFVQWISQTTNHFNCICFLIAILVLCTFRTKMITSLGAIKPPYLWLLTRRMCNSKRKIA